LWAVKKQVLLYVTVTAGTETFSFKQKVATTAECAYGRFCFRILEYANLILTEDFLGRRDITSIRAGNRIFDTATRLLAGEFFV
jgi:hypothetical protein